MDGWYDAALRAASEYSKAEYAAQLAANRGKRLKQFTPPEIAVALCKAAGRGDEVECKRLMHIGRCGAWSLV